MSKRMVISEVFGAELAAEGVRFRKSAKTLLRRVRAEEVGSELVTFVGAAKAVCHGVDATKGDGAGGVRMESKVVLEAGAVVARNDVELSAGIFNEWLISAEVVKKNYGVEVFEGLGDEFVGYRKVGEVVAIELTQERFERCAQMGYVPRPESAKGLGCVEVCREGGLPLPGQGTLQEGEDVLIAVSWSKDPMRARVGDWLTSGGYSISGVDMGAYERV